MDRDTRPLCAVLQHDLEHRGTHGFATKSKDRAERVFAMPFLLVVQKLIADVGGDVGRVAPEVHASPLARIAAA